jgi:hypothetical protein
MPPNTANRTLSDVCIHRSKRQRNEIEEGGLFWELSICVDYLVALQVFSEDVNRLGGEVGSVCEFRGHLSGGVIRCFPVFLRENRN